MKLNIKFGLMGDKEVDWWRPVDTFPKTIKYLNVIYEWVFFHDDDSQIYDKILVFSELKEYDSRYSGKHETWNDLFGDQKSSCSCGARHSSFPWDHLRYCSEWKKW